jgi:hypothetical protein
VSLLVIEQLLFGFFFPLHNILITYFHNGWTKDLAAR